VSRAVLPGARIGVLGSGQLGRMFALEARRMGYRVHTYSPDLDTPTGQISDVEVVAPYSDLDRVREFARGVDVITFEFENVPAETAATAALHAPVRPAGSVLHTTQQRRREKEFLATNGFPLPPHAFVHSRADLDAAIARIGTPAVLKSAEFGYDGKGQRRIDSAADAPSAWRELGERECVLEGWVDFERECSILAARGLDGSFAHWGLIENRHAQHILDVSSVPAEVPQPLERQAIELARALVERLEVVGVLCIELFVTRKGELWINELAPRPHNSGHLTLDASLTSQFEQQLRAVCGLPLGATDWLSPAAMANLLGDLWQRGEPDWAGACAQPRVKLHLYGKAQPKPGRKMGHLTVLAPSAKQAVEEVVMARKRLADARS